MNKRMRLAHTLNMIACALVLVVTLALHAVSPFVFDPLVVIAAYVALCLRYHAGWRQMHS
jgi:hypothetical protein